MKRLNPPQIIIMSFLSAILMGTVLLSLPIATNGPGRLGLTDAVFTATSATCVTGLIVKDTGTFFSPFGQIVILLLFQAGGLGIMTFSILFAILLGKKLSIKENVIVQGALDHHKIEGLPKLLKYIFIISLGIELIGAWLLYIRFSHIQPFSVLKNIYYCFFHSVSAFCNAGFSLYSTSFMKFRGDIYINFVLTTLIIIGGLGFVVLLDIPKFRPWRSRDKMLPRVCLQTKMVVFVTLAALILGMAMIFLLEYGNALNNLGIKDKLLCSYFQIVTSRTAGFNTLPTGMLTTAALWFLLLFMFVGASPGSTGGGIKTTTFAILLAGYWAILNKKKEVTIFKKTISKEIFQKALVIFMLAASWIFLTTFLLCYTERATLGPEHFLTKIIFEVFSAFGTVGLSTGITSSLSVAGKLILSLTMLVGRIGPLTLALAITMKQAFPVEYKYSEERVMVG